MCKGPGCTRCTANVADSTARNDRGLVVSRHLADHRDPDEAGTSTYQYLARVANKILLYYFWKVRRTLNRGKRKEAEHRQPKIKD